MDSHYRLYFDTVEEANQAVKYIETCLENRGRISKYELELAILGAGKSTITDMDKGWTSSEELNVIRWKELNGEWKWMLTLPLPKKWFG